MDELGRGTTTFDGLAIAYSVLKYITEHLMCKAFFATHYHILLDEFKNNPHIGLYFMNYQIDNNERIRFLYRLTEGECSRSFGLNISRIAGIDEEVVNRAKEKAIEFESNTLKQKEKTEEEIFCKLMKKLRLIENHKDKVEMSLYVLEEALI